MVDDILRGLAMMPMESMDNRVTDEVTNHLFEQKKPKSGKSCFDLFFKNDCFYASFGYL